MKMFGKLFIFIEYNYIQK